MKTISKLGGCMTLLSMYLMVIGICAGIVQSIYINGGVVIGVVSGLLIATALIGGAMMLVGFVREYILND